MEEGRIVSDSSDSDHQGAPADSSELWKGETSSDGPLSDVTSSDGADDSVMGIVRRFCVNCTARLLDDVCEDCGHVAAHDEALFDAQQASSGLGQDAQRSQQVALLYDERMELHDEGGSSPHPERPDRIRAIVSTILASGVGARCLRVPCREATIPELATVHTAELIRFVEDVSKSKALFGPNSGLSISPDTYANAHTYMCARLAAGGAAEVASIVARGEATHGAAIVRPPGHHAESGMAMGFCFFNNAAVAARAAQAAGAQRVIILDWDIHHGNGTQHIFEDDPSVLYMSLHRYDGGSFYPGTGAADEVGLADGEGFNVNIPWDSPDMSNGDYLGAFNQVLMPIAYEFNPDLIIVSAGFDAADGDPIGECRVTPECFGHMTAMLKAVAPLVLLLEGGYNLRSTAVSTEACLRVLLGEAPVCLPGPRYPSPAGWRAIQEAMQVQSMYWKSLQPPGPEPELLLPQGMMPLPRAPPLRPDVAPTACPSSAKPEPESPSESLQDFSRSGLAGSAGVGAGDVTSPKRRPHPSRGSSSSSLRSAPARCKVLLAIHKRALRAFWKRKRRMHRDTAADA